MAFIDANLHRINELGNGKSEWFYHTTDTHATIDTADYFLAAIGKIKVGDRIKVNVYTSAITGALSTAGEHVCNSNTGTSIDVTDVTALTVTDSD